MKIVLVGANYRIQGGSDRHFLALERLLESRGHRVVPFAARHPENLGAAGGHDFPPGVDPVDPSPVDAARFVYNPSARRAMSRLLEKHRPDLAHLHVYSGQLSASILKPLRDHGIPTIQTLHDFKLACPVRTFVSQDRVCEACRGGHFWRALPRRCNRGSLARTALNVAESYASRLMGDVGAIDRFVAVSNFLRAKMLEHGVVPPHRIDTIHNFLDADSVRPAEGPGEHLAYVGRLTPLKGVDVLLEAASELDGAELFVAGDGRSRSELEVRAREGGMDHVRFVGFQGDRDLERLVRGSICTVLPSIGYETFGLAALESLALGRPVIASRIGGLPEVVDDGVDGFLVPPGDVEALRQRMRWMLRHPDEAVAMGAAGRRKVEERFDPDSHYESLRGVYEAVLSGAAA